MLREKLSKLWFLFPGDSWADTSNGEAHLVLYHTDRALMIFLLLQNKI